MTKDMFVSALAAIVAICAFTAAIRATDQSVWFTVCSVMLGCGMLAIAIIKSMEGERV